MARARLLIALLAAMAPSAACYRYVPAAHPEVGRPVRVELAAEGTRWLTPQLGPDATQLEGVVLNTDSQQISLLVHTYATRRHGILSFDDAVLLQPVHLITLTEKRLDPVRSALLGLTLAAGAILAIEVLGGEQRIFEQESPEEPGPPKLRNGFRPATGRGFVRLPLR